MTVHIYPDRDIDRTLYDPAFITHMVMDRIHENNCIDLFQRKRQILRLPLKSDLVYT